MFKFSDGIHFKQEFFTVKWIRKKTFMSSSTTKCFSCPCMPR